MNWISVITRLPKEWQVVLLTFKNSVGIHVGEATYKDSAFYYVAETDCGCFEEVYSIPLAWMEMPKPCVFSVIS